MHRFKICGILSLGLMKRINAIRAKKYRPESERYKREVFKWENY